MNVGKVEFAPDYKSASVRLILDESEAKTRRIQELLAQVEKLESRVGQAVMLLELARNPGQHRKGRCTGKIDCNCWQCQVDDYIAQNTEPYNRQDETK